MKTFESKKLQNKKIQKNYKSSKKPGKLLLYIIVMNQNLVKNSEKRNTVDKKKRRPLVTKNFVRNMLTLQCSARNMLTLQSSAILPFDTKQSGQY